MAETGGVKSEDTPFEGGPMDGRVLPVLLGITGHPPKTYRIPVPAPDGGPPTVLVYRRVPRGRSTLTGLTAGSERRWPWSRPAPRPDATPQGKPDDADG